MNRPGGTSRGGSPREGRIAPLLLLAFAVLAVSLQLGGRCLAAGTTLPAGGANEPSSFENQPIRHSAGATTRPGATSAPASMARQQPNLLDYRRVLLALGIVVGLILVLRWIGRRFFPALAGGRSAGVVRVLCRTPISTKQQVVLLHVGRRVIVASDNGLQMTALSQITDADEVASLIGQINGGSAGAAPSREAFDSALDQAQGQFEQDLTSSEASAKPGVATRTAEEPDESLATTRTEIDGLLEKVRGLAKQVGSRTG